MSGGARRPIGYNRGVRVLHVIDSLAPGGAERSLVEMAPHLSRLGVDLEIAVLHERGGFEADLAGTGIPVLSLAGPGGRRARAGRALALVRRRRPDLVHTSLFESDLAGRMAAVGARVPVVSSIVNAVYGADRRAQPGVRAWRLAAAQLADAGTSRAVRRFHSVSRWLAELASRHLWIPRRRIDVIPRGRDAARLGRRSAERRLAARSGLGVGDDDVLLLALARHEYQKGLDVLLRALPAVTGHHPARVRLAVAGREGRETGSLRSLTAELGVGELVSFLGFRSDVGDLLAAADVFVLPTRWEGLPGAVLEAMALEAPIVATDLPPVREAVTAGVEAILVPPGQPDELASAILEALDDEARTAARVEAARSRFLRDFSIERVSEAMVEFYERSLQR